MSSVIEFQVQVTDGVILIPEQYKRILNPSENVRVILIQQDAHPMGLDSSSSGTDFLREFLDHPSLIPSFVPLTRDEIYER